MPPGCRRSGLPIWGRGRAPDMSEAPPHAAPEAPDSPTEPEPEPEPTPLPHPQGGVPDLSVTIDEIDSAARLLAEGTGAFAVDAERASGFRYSNRAYLIQIRRAGAGTVLIDPVSHGGDSQTVLRPVADVLATDAWILHAADQDLPCLAEVGMRPPALYDTELAGRLAGIDRVNLATMVQRLLGLGLAKGHSEHSSQHRPGGTAGDAHRASTRCETRADWLRCGSCGPHATGSRRAETSLRAGFCPIRPSLPPRPRTPRQWPN